MYAYEKFAARPTLDIDFLGNNISNEGSSIIAAFREICSVPYEEDGVIFDTEHITAQNITEFKDYHGIRLSVPVKMDTIAQVLTMDIGFGDVVTPSPIDLIILYCLNICRAPIFWPTRLKRLLPKRCTQLWILQTKAVE